MPCTPVTLPGGQRAIVCTTARRCACGRRADRLCDWKVDGGTCDKPLCSRCSIKPADDKDLCPVHGEAWEAWKADRQRSKNAGLPPGG